MEALEQQVKKRRHRHEGETNAGEE